MEDTIAEAASEMLERAHQIDNLLGVRVEFGTIGRYEHQEVSYKDTFRTQVQLSIEKYGGTIVVKEVRSMVKFSVANSLIAFRLNSLLRGQALHISAIVKRCTLISLREYGIKEFPVGFMVAATSLYNILQGIAVIGIKHVITYFDASRQRSRNLDETGMELAYEMFPT